MIRINLLPQARKQVRAPSSSGGAIWGVVYAAAIVGLAVVLAVVYVVNNGYLAEQKSQNDQLQSRIDELKQRSARLEEVQAQLSQSQELENLVGELNRARTGPTRMLMEVSRILTAAPRGGPTIDPEAQEALRRDNPYAGYNPSWDVTRLWLTGFWEEGRSCRITGRGRSNEDVAEFFRRLSLSELFEDVALTRTEQIEDQATGLEFDDFELTARVRY